MVILENRLRLLNLVNVFLLVVLIQFVFVQALDACFCLKSLYIVLILLVENSASGQSGHYITVITLRTNYTLLLVLPLYTLLLLLVSRVCWRFT